MNIRWTEAEAREHGFRQDSDGEWYHPDRHSSSGRISSPRRSHHPRAVSESKPNVHGAAPAAIKTAKRTEDESKDGDYRIFVVAYRRRHVDPDNLCPKWYIDELVKANILPDDSSKYIESITKKVVVSRGQEETRIFVYKRATSGV